METLSVIKYSILLKGLWLYKKIYEEALVL